MRAPEGDEQTRRRPKGRLSCFYGEDEMLELKDVVTEADWESLHRLRETVLFTEARHPGIKYDRAHPHDTNPAHIKLLLVDDGVPVGTTRLDPRADGSVIVRLVAITPERQRQGLGRELERVALARAREMGAHKVMLNAAADAVGFYEKCGWVREVWDEIELATFGKGCVQMSKRL